MSARIRVLIVLGLLAICAALPASAEADFGFSPGSVSVTARNLDGTLDAQAGSHPGSLQVSFVLNSEGETTAGGAMRDVLVELPPGLVGDLASMPQCSTADFEGATPNCPGSTQVGVIQANAVGLGEVVDPVYNVEPPPGKVAEFGFSVFNYVPLQFSSLRSDEGYGVSVLAPNIPLEIKSVTETIWGTPSDPIHDPQRVCGNVTGHGNVQGCSADVPHVPFLTLPTSCGPLEITVKADSDQNPGAYVAEKVSMLDDGKNVAPLHGCESVPFEPAISALSSSQESESPAGLDFELSLPNKGLRDPRAIAETVPQKTVVSLPQGVAVNPSAAAGIVGCSEAEYKAATGEPGSGCPEASKVGTLVAKTPLLDEAIEGSVYLAQPQANQFGSLLALYIVAKAGERGVLVKQAGKVEADPATGQLTTTFDDLPPVPYSAFEFKLREGPRAPLTTPQVCGEYTTTAKLYPFSDPGAETVRTAPFKVTTGAGGSSCAADEGQLPSHPTLEAGATTPLAGAYSPFVFRVRRGDGEQRFSSISANLPAGLLGRIAGVPYCPESGIAQAGSRTEEGGAALEQSSPSCPEASQVGTVNVSAGSGPQPYYVQGKAYLAGPYKGAPLSLEIVTPATAGPFDLGSVAVRTALYVNEATAQIHAVSDPLPTILHGIPLDVRTISLQMDRKEFTLNPTSCEAKSVTGAVSTQAGATAQLSNRFAVGGCAGLAFAPKLKLAFSGATKRTGNPAVRAVLTQPQGENANIAGATVILPKGMFIDQSHVNAPCTRVQFNSTPVPGEGCPAKSLLGTAKVWTPLLDHPEEGPVYFRSNGGERELPDMVIALRGQIPLQLVGFIDSVGSKHAEARRVRSRFLGLPDAPVSRFELKLAGGKRGLLENSVNLCRAANRAKIQLAGQNGKRYETQPKIQVPCGKAGKKGHKKH